MNQVLLIIVLLLPITPVLGQVSPLGTKHDTTRITSPYYLTLGNELYRYREILKKGGWNKLNIPKKSWQQGDSSIDIKMIKKRLMITMENNGHDSSNIFSETLTQNVMGYQKRNGLKIDGMVGKETLRALNITAAERVKQIELNLERLLDLPENLGDRYIMVNVPAFTLLAIENNKISFSCRVVAGKESDKTALFKGKMKYIVFGPYWNIPESIMKKEILPEIKKNPNYLTENHMEWHEEKIRQKPGPWNALGKVKFIFPNEYNMYMHDTPAKTLFNEVSRAFSHGCIRVSEPIKLASFLLAEDRLWTLEKIKASIETKVELYVNLNENIPVYIVYFTAYVDSNGELNFRNDVYGRNNYLYY